MVTLPEPSADVLDEVVDTRRALHRRPELAFEERETSALIDERLRRLGLEVHGCPTETGAVAGLDTGRPGRTVLLRADIDALPIQEDSGEPFASTLDGRMHACGHDAHVAIMLGVARTLAEWRGGAGRYVFCFQPAEEIVSGARRMLDGGIPGPAPDAAIGLHIASFLPLGAVQTRAGLLWAGCDKFDIVIEGPGGHGAMVKRAGNVLLAQAFVLQRLFDIVEGLETDGTQCHTTIGLVRSDGASNIVPRHVRMEGTIRTFTPEQRDEAVRRLGDLLLETGTEFGVTATLDVPRATVPVRNDGAVTAAVLETAREVVGDGAEAIARPMTLSDDMSEFLARTPGCYFMLGACPPGADPPPAHHSPQFRIAEDAFPTGVRVLARAAARLAAG
jgi:amidohydrolase